LVSVLVGLLCCWYVLSAPVFVQSFIAWMEGPRPGPETLRPHYDVAIVLAGMVAAGRSRLNEPEFTEQVDRILAGIRLVKRGVADKLMIVGGHGDPFKHYPSEARQLRTFALEFGLQEEQILLEEFSRTTYENAVQASAILRAGPYSDLVLVTTALHMPRAAAVFRKQGLFPDRYPVDFQSGVDNEFSLLSLMPSADTFNIMRYALHELLGLMMYRLQGYL